MIQDAGSYILIEWAERLGVLLPKKRIDIHFAVDSGSQHHIDIREVKG
jgi:tRNA A37 threonylcarbamoyladenosine biosynthesis protein TsaE